ncbi:MAG TPA: A24 family peptidase [Candidatus Bathyarchaeia archaeon]|nr:A24 family peptidase [Candidatus Bathyarchaeia archaeon]
MMEGVIRLLSTFILFPICLVMAVAVYTDIRRRLIYDWLTLPGIVYFLLVHAFLHSEQWFDYLLGVIVMGGISLLMAILSRGQLGGGDIKLLALVGAAVGWQAGIYVLLFTYLLASFVAIPVWIVSKWRKNRERKLEFPMAPFIAGGTSLLILIVFAQ